MFFYKYRKFFIVLVCFSLLLPAFTAPAFAESAEEDPYLILTPEDVKNAKEDMKVGTLQERLTELGYYTEKITLILDATTRFALYNFCSANGVAYDDGGIRQSTWDALMSEDAIPAEGSVEYPFISYGTESDAVFALQERLRELQYYEGMVLTPGVYNADLQKAIDRFCEINAVSYDRSGLTTEVQKLIYSQGAIPYAKPEEERSLAERFADYMMRDADLLVIVVPVFVVWILIMFLALIVVFFVLRLLQKRKGERQSTGAAKVDRNRKVMPPPLPEKRRIIRIQIDYQDKTWNLEKDAFGPLTIGRGTVDIRLDSADQGVERKHCVLFFKGAILMLRDESDHGTYVNDTVFRKCTTPLQSGDHIVIGSHHIFLRF